MGWYSSLHATLWQAPLANDAEACRKFYNKTLAILKECDPSFEPASGPIEESYVKAQVDEQGLAKAVELEHNK